MAEDTPLERSEDETLRCNRAVMCGLTVRNGPSPDEIATMAWWKRGLLPLLPPRQRWRLSALAPEIRHFMRTVGRPTPEQLS